jgi:glycolate oxidase FAD binding subunit
MSAACDQTEELCAAVRQARADAIPLRIEGTGSKDFYGARVAGKSLSTLGHRGVLSYEPTELVLTARAGTPLQEVESLLAERGQMLPFEPPHFGADATFGGTVACGLSGPARPYAGSVRDFVLGVKCINGDGEVLQFGGQVMKNVAGYDVARLMVGAQGTLGVLLEISVKVLPAPSAQTTRCLTLTQTEALTAMNAYAGRPLPLTGACYDGDRLYLRLAGSERAVKAAAAKIGGDELSEGNRFWAELREMRHAFFAGPGPVWRLSLPPGTPMPNIDGKWLIDWGGALRWLRSDTPPTAIRRAAEKQGGSATLFRKAETHGEVFHPLAPALHKLHAALKRSFDPAGILNPGRLYPTI